jgi:NAD(P)-dependent dehydrogenase (short-subunit alcohol dehydrogenase family)
MVTGANSGVGLVSARELARQGWSVLLVCRDRARGEEALASVRASASGPPPELLLADFASLDDVRRLAADVAGRRIDVLMNNAGLMLTERRETRDGFETTFGVNHLAPFLLTNLLLDGLRANAPTRIVNVSSRAHTRTTLDFDDLNAEKSFDGWQAYCRSKLCNVLFNQELARRLEGTGVTANALHPGMVATGFGRETSGLWGALLKVGRFVMTTPEKGARTQVWLATAPEVAGMSGRYFIDCKAVATSRAGADPVAAARLWGASAKMVGLPA